VRAPDLATAHIDKKVTLIVRREDRRARDISLFSKKYHQVGMFPVIDDPYLERQN
jgi:hypothetical protein